MEPTHEAEIDLLSMERRLWREGRRRIAGIDEAGRGPLAGPVVAAAVILPENVNLPGLNDSKQLSPSQRAVLYDQILSVAEVAIATADVETIDQLNILRATHQAMREAVAQLNPPPDMVLVDGLPIGPTDFPYEAVVKGDARSASIAAASIVAKVTRDRQMIELDRLYPEYGFAEHKGYYCRRHVEALRRYGPCPIHRRSFDPLKTMLSQRSFDF